MPLQLASPLILYDEKNLSLQKVNNFQVSPHKKSEGFMRAVHRSHATGPHLPIQRSRKFCIEVLVLATRLLLNSTILMKNVRSLELGYLGQSMVAFCCFEYFIFQR